MKKRMISLCLVLSMVLTFAGCGNESNGSADNTQGNVQELAGWVQEETGGDLFSIQVTDSYPSDWDACLERANEERGEDARPELTSSVENLDAYDTVFLGYPKIQYGFLSV